MHERIMIVKLNPFELFPHLEANRLNCHEVCCWYLLAYTWCFAYVCYGGKPFGVTSLDIYGDEVSRWFFEWFILFFVCFESLFYIWNKTPTTVTGQWWSARNPVCRRINILNWVYPLQTFYREPGNRRCYRTMYIFNSSEILFLVLSSCTSRSEQLFTTTVPCSRWSSLTKINTRHPIRGHSLLLKKN